MSGDDDSSNDAELSSLARDSESIRSSKNASRSSTKGAVATPSSASSGATLSPQQKAKLSLTARGENFLWIFGILILCAVAYFGNFLEPLRFGLIAEADVSEVGTRFWTKPLKQKELARTTLATELAVHSNNIPERIDAALTQAQIAARELESKFGKKDLRVVFSNLKLASIYYDCGKYAACKNTWEPQIQYLRKKTANTPDGMPQAIYDLFVRYDNMARDSDAIILLGKALLQYAEQSPAGDLPFPNSAAAPQPTTFAEVLGQMGEAYEFQEENYAEAYKCYLKANVIGSNDSPLDRQITSLTRIARTANSLGKINEARKYAESALSLTRKLTHDASNQETAQDAIPLLEIARSEAGTGKLVDASKRFKHCADLMIKKNNLIDVRVWHDYVRSVFYRGQIQAKTGYKEYASESFQHVISASNSLLNDARNTKAEQEPLQPSLAPMRRQNMVLRQIIEHANKEIHELN